MQQPDPAWQISTLADSARTLADRGEKAEAEKIYQQILQVAPYHIRALNFLSVRAMEKGDLETSQQYLERALRAAPERPILHENMAVVHRARGELTQALASLDRAIALKPGFRTALLQKGSILEQLGKPDEAVEAFYLGCHQLIDYRQPVTSDSVAPALHDLVSHAAAMIRLRQMALFDEALEPVRARHGNEALSRVQAAAEDYLGERPVKREHALQRPSFVYIPDVAPRAFFERTDIPWMPQLETATAGILAELQAVLADGEGLAPYVQIDAGQDPQQWRELNGSTQWSSFHFIKAGQWNAANCARCPYTTEVLKSLPLPQINGHSPEALFSILRPGTHIPPHFGLGNYKLAVHLPLVVPPDCAIRVGNETRGWSAGEGLAFDDSFQHEAWNKSDKVRAVLIIDAWNPLLSQAETEGMSALIGAVNTFNLKYQR